MLNLRQSECLASLSRLAIGASCWVACAQFFVVQMIVMMTWKSAYSLSANFISDLGAFRCGYFPVGSQSYVCSPFHAVMNASMIVQGALMLGGALLLAVALKQSRSFTIARIGIACAGVGSIIVGCFPEDIATKVHYAGAAFHLISGNLGVLFLAGAIPKSTPLHRRLTRAICVCGACGFIATILLGIGIDGGLGIGGMERLAVYPFPIALIAFGGVLLREATLLRVAQRRNSSPR